MTTHYKVSLHPRYDTTMELNDLELVLGPANFSEIMPSDSGARKNFYFAMKNIASQYGVTFKLQKETTRDVVWSLHQGKAHLGTYMVVLGDRSHADRRPVWRGCKSRKQERGRFATDRALARDIFAALDDALSTRSCNSWTFHRLVAAWMRRNADLVEPRPSGNGKQKEMKSSYYYMSVSHKDSLDIITDLYGRFNMNITLEEVTI